MGIYDISGNKLIVDTGCSPENYGAIGDGIHDDTSAIQAAFNESELLNIPVSFGFGKTYCISSTLNLKKRQNIYGNGSTIKATSAIADIIRINTETQHVTTSVGKGLLENITIDCNGVAQNGIYVQHATGFELQNIDVLRFTNHGIHIASGFEIFCTNIRLAVGGTSVIPNAIGTVGLYMDTYDSHFTNIVPINCEIGVVDKKGGNFYYGVHPWNTRSDIMPTSIMFDAYGALSAVNCYNDCCTIGIKVNGSFPVNVFGMKILGSTNFMPSSVMGSVVPEAFHLTNAAATSRIKAYGIYFSANLTYKFSNLAASAWTGFSWLENNDTSITSLQDHPTV